VCVCAHGIQACHALEAHSAKASEDATLALVSADSVQAHELARVDGKGDGIARGGGEGKGGNNGEGEGGRKGGKGGGKGKGKGEVKGGGKGEGREKGGMGEGILLPQLRTHCYRALLEVILADLAGKVAEGQARGGSGVGVGGDALREWLGVKAQVWGKGEKSYPTHTTNRSNEFQLLELPNFSY
jgi:hypothetical protein